jgi:hypothetical protein
MTLFLLFNSSSSDQHSLSLNLLKFMLVSCMVVHILHTCGIKHVFTLRILKSSIFLVDTVDVMK